MSLDRDFDLDRNVLAPDFEEVLAVTEPLAPLQEVAASAPVRAEHSPKVLIHYRTHAIVWVLFAISILAFSGSIYVNYSRPRLPWEPALPGESSLAKKFVSNFPQFKNERFDHEFAMPADPDLRSIARNSGGESREYALSLNLPPIGPVAHLGAFPDANPQPGFENIQPGEGKKRGDLIDPLDVWNDIVREADDRKAKDEEAKQFKDERPAQARREAMGRLMDLKQQADANRKAFRQALKAVVDRSGPKAGQEVRRLVEEMHQEVPNDVLVQAKYLKENSAARLGRSEQLDLFRAIGLPETSLLYHLVELERQKAGIRGGPRTLDEAWARAAKALLNSPPGPKSQVVPPVAKLYFIPNGPGRNAARTTR